jgi:hypothetical protein
MRKFSTTGAFFPNEFAFFTVCCWALSFFVGKKTHRSQLPERLIFEECPVCPNKQHGMDAGCREEEKKETRVYR